MRFMKRIVMLLFLSVMVCTLSAQEKKGETIGERIVANAYNADSIRGILDKMPYFTLFKDNYFVGGTTLGHKPTAALSVYPVHSEGFLECLSGIVAHEGP